MSLMDFACVLGAWKVCNILKDLTLCTIRITKKYSAYSAIVMTLLRKRPTGTGLSAILVEKDLGGCNVR